MPKISLTRTSRLTVTALACSLLALSACGLAKASKPKVMLPSIAAPKAAENETLVSLRPTNIEREGIMRFTIGPNGMPSFAEPEKEKLVHGELKVASEQASFFLPLYGPHELASSENHSFQNTSTRISVDANHDGELERSEHWWTSLPIRLGDQMFDVTAIDPGSKWIMLKKSEAKLAGMVVGKPCPDFSFLTTNGYRATQDTFKGKWLLLDVWSMT